MSQLSALFRGLLFSGSKSSDPSCSPGAIETERSVPEIERSAIESGRSDGGRRAETGRLPTAHIATRAAAGRTTLYRSALLPVFGATTATVLVAGLIGACSGGDTGDAANGPRKDTVIMTDSAGRTHEVPALSAQIDTGEILVTAAPTPSAPPTTNVPTSRPPNCGDNKLNSDEICDDGNLDKGDGCSDFCAAEPGYSCVQNVCVRVPLCGDGKIDVVESCDDGNILAGDGCNATCATEDGFDCPLEGQPCISNVKCGDLQIRGDETCDDGQMTPTSGDGCDDHCHIEAGWVCVLGSACTALCGDGKVGPGETCDDGNLIAGDGCNSTCQREAGDPATGLSWECPDAIGTGGACHQAVCGDSKPEGDESCDKGNDNNLGDGCSPGCKAEPDCSKGACTSICGDGLLLSVEAMDPTNCDDGNTRDGDGCSSKCKVEGGYLCATVRADDADTLDLPIVYRDFRGKGLDFKDDPRKAYDTGGHPDFENFNFSIANPSYKAAKGIVDTKLGANGKPVYKGGESKKVTTGQKEFDQWFNDTVGVNKTLLSTVHLTRDGATAPFVLDEDDFFPLDNEGLVKDGTEKARTKTWGDPSASTFELSCWDKAEWGSTWDTDAPRCTGLAWSDPYYKAGDIDHTADKCVDTHNYSFTSEVRYWFEYKGGEKLVFRGDDDVFVFINKQLVVDLGGLHEPLGGDVCGHSWPLVSNSNVAACAAADTETADGTCLDGSDGDAATRGVLTTTPACGGLGATDAKAVTGLTAGQVYEVAVFQAERHTCQSNYRLELAGFTQAHSDCKAECGNSIVTPGEACDEGPLAADGMSGNGAGYNHCTADCKFGPRCGDNIKQDQEECDNGSNISQYRDSDAACAPGCKLAPTCGDGKLNPKYEECDLGTAKNDGKYGSCKPDCRLAPRCGDTKIDADQGEECDDGGRINGDGCNAACKKEKILIRG